MKVRYNRCWYEINTKDAFWILGQELWLANRRLLRGFKRIFIYSKQLWIVVFSAIVFSAAILILGFSLEKYDTLYDGLWDIKLFFFSSIFIVLFGNIVSSETRRRQLLKIQHLKYISFLFESDQYIISLCRIGGFEYESDIFLTEEHLNRFTEVLESHIRLGSMVKVDSNYLPKHMDEKIFMKSICDSYFNKLQEIKNYMNSGDLVGSDNYYARSYIDYPLDEIRSEKIIIDSLTDTELEREALGFANHISALLIHVIPQLRRPWRWDFARNQNIRRLLKNKGVHIGREFDRNEYWQIE